ncbi:transcriptional regulator [Actinoplanes italicus]|uniref:MarR family transcriptional regulator n=1 Tax=Actinoplanes italicus TaxID=113567 RepID=A0A2T0JD09_9ACTN|nr:MarR family winged helix-turn-helix transcriptional regulator [Actinoplanes italicus]PRX05527.1 MarR family transcriptional regulator [Actinoplanes italicus]GIE35967.1 transcriptional regulator [Actinoplanes italicus]
MRRSERKQQDPDLGVLAGQLLFSIQDELFAMLADQGHPGLRAQHGAVLAYLDAEGSRATDLARQSGQHKQVVGKLIDELEVLGYVERHPDPSDRRAKLIVPTALGLDQMERSDAIVAGIEERAASAVGVEAYAAFKDLLRRVGAHQRARA